MKPVGGGADSDSLEAAWLASARLARCPPMSWGKPRSVVVLAPHPDDDILALGGTMRRLVRAGTRLAIVAITEGEASHPRSPTTSNLELSIRRADERRRALILLGITADVTRLRYPHGGVTIAYGLAQRLMSLVRGADLCLAPWERDGEADHDATGVAAELACTATGVRLVSYPVWAWRWATPDGNDLPWRRAHRSELAADELVAKRAAIAAHRTQLQPLSALAGDEPNLPHDVLSHFQRPFEVVFV